MLNSYDHGGQNENAETEVSVGTAIGLGCDCCRPRADRLSWLYAPPDLAGYHHVGAGALLVPIAGDT